MRPTSGKAAYKPSTMHLLTGRIQDGIYLGGAAELVRAVCQHQRRLVDLGPTLRDASSTLYQMELMQPVLGIDKVSPAALEAALDALAWSSSPASSPLSCSFPCSACSSPSASLDPEAAPSCSSRAPGPDSEDEFGLMPALLPKSQRPFIASLGLAAVAPIPPPTTADGAVGPFRTSAPVAVPAVQRSPEGRRVATRIRRVRDKSRGKSSGGAVSAAPAAQAGLAGIAHEALRFVAMARARDGMVARADALQSAYDAAALNLAEEEHATRGRLLGARLELAEGISRNVVAQQYEKFVVFALDSEPIWRRAARRLQQRNEQLQLAAQNSYRLFEFQENMMQEKLTMLSEARDYLLSLKLMQEDELELVLRAARLRRRTSTITRSTLQDSLAGTPASLDLASRPVVSRELRHPRIAAESLDSSGNGQLRSRNRHAVAAPSVAPQPAAPTLARGRAFRAIEECLPRQPSGRLGMSARSTSTFPGATATPVTPVPAAPRTLRPAALANRAEPLVPTIASPGHAEPVIAIVAADDWVAYSQPVYGEVVRTRSAQPRSRARPAPAGNGRRYPTSSARRDALSSGPSPIAH